MKQHIKYAVTVKKIKIIYVITLVVMNCYGEGGNCFRKGKLRGQEKANV